MLSSPQRRLLKEADIDRRRAERGAAGGGPDQGAILLKQKLRTGELSERNVKIAARLGDEAAGLLVPNDFSTRKRQIDGLQVAADRGTRGDLSVNELANFAADLIEKVFVSNTNKFNDEEKELARHTLAVLRDGQRTSEAYDAQAALTASFQSESFETDAQAQGIKSAVLYCLYFALVISAEEYIGRVLASLRRVQTEMIDAGLTHDEVRERYIDYLLGRV